MKIRYFIQNVVKYVIVLILLDKNRNVCVKQGSNKVSVISSSNHKRTDDRRIFEIRCFEHMTLELYVRTERVFSFFSEFAKTVEMLFP